MAAQKRFELADIQVVDLIKNPDERGFFAEAARKDWRDLFGEKWISQANVSQSYPGVIRAWHRHAGRLLYRLAGCSEDCSI